MRRSLAFCSFRRDRPRALWLAIVLLSLVPSTTYAQADDDTSEVEYYEPPVVHEAARDVLDGPEFRNLPRLDLGPGGTTSEPLKPKDVDEKDSSATVRAPSAAGTFIAGLFGGAVSIAVVAVLALVLGAIVLLVVLGLRQWERTTKRETRSEADAAADDEPDPIVSPGDRPADAWLAAARSAAAAGRFDEALALLLLGAMGHAERAGLIRPRRGLTYRDYLRAVPDSSAWHSALDMLVRVYAPVGFGRRPATAAAFESVVGPYESALAVEPGATVGRSAP